MPSGSDFTWLYLVCCLPNLLQCYLTALYTYIRTYIHTHVGMFVWLEKFFRFNLALLLFQHFEIDRNGESGSKNVQLSIKNFSKGVVTKVANFLLSQKKENARIFLIERLSCPECQIVFEHLYVKKFRSFPQSLL